MLGPYSSVNHADDDAVPRAARSPDCRPHPTRHVDELGRVRGGGTHDLVPLHEGHRRVPLQQAHLRGGQTGGKPVHGEGVAGGREGGREGRVDGEREGEKERGEVG